MALKLLKNNQKWLKMAKNGFKLAKMALKLLKNNQKWLKLAKNGQ